MAKAHGVVVITMAGMEVDMIHSDGGEVGVMKVMRRTYDNGEGIER